MAYLEERPLARRQYWAPRRGFPSGQIGLHTAESIMDEVGIDSGAENVASYMTRRTSAGSYHDLVDSDSSIHLVSYGNEAFHVGVHLLNRTTTGLSFAVRTVDWARMSADYREATLRRGAVAARRQSEYHQAHGAGPVPGRLLTLDEVLRGERGFYYHGDVDPSRRSDPGVGPPGPAFPWDEFRSYYLEDDMPADDVWDLDISKKHPHPDGDLDARASAATVLLDTRGAAVAARNAASAVSTDLSTVTAMLRDLLGVMKELHQAMAGIGGATPVPVSTAVLQQAIREALVEVIRDAASPFEGNAE